MFCFVVHTNLSTELCFRNVPRQIQGHTIHRFHLQMWCVRVQVFGLVMFCFLLANMFYFENVHNNVANIPRRIGCQNILSSHIENDIHIHIHVQLFGIGLHLHTTSASCNHKSLLPSNIVSFCHANLLCSTNESNRSKSVQPDHM